MTDCKTYACCWEGCQAVIHLHHDVDVRVRETGERFYCPAGHAQSFTNSIKSREQHRIEDLERQVEHLLSRMHEAREEREDWKEFSKVCPFGCGYRVTRRRSQRSIAFALQYHLAEEHGAHILEPTEATA